MCITCVALLNPNAEGLLSMLKLSSQNKVSRMSYMSVMHGNTKEAAQALYCTSLNYKAHANCHNVAFCDLSGATHLPLCIVGHCWLHSLYTLHTRGTCHPYPVAC